jgi:hypothetical protein
MEDPAPDPDEYCFPKMLLVLSSRADYYADYDIDDSSNPNILATTQIGYTWVPAIAVPIEFVSFVSSQYRANQTIFPVALSPFRKWPNVWVFPPKPLLELRVSSNTIVIGFGACRASFPRPTVVEFHFVNAVKLLSGDCLSCCCC